MTRRDRPGVLIVVSGIDGSGKSTLIGGLRTLLVKDGHEVVVVSPMKGESGFIKDLTILPDRLVPDRTAQEAFVGEYISWVMARSAHRIIEPAMSRGCVVLSDRWVVDHVVSQRWFGVEVDAAAQPLVGMPRPSLLIYLDMEPSEAQARIERRGKAGAGEGLPFLTFFRTGLQLELATTEHVAVDGGQAGAAMVQECLPHVRASIIAAQETAKAPRPDSRGASTEGRFRLN